MNRFFPTVLLFSFTYLLSAQYVFSQADAVIINKDKSQDIYVYYDNILTERYQITLEPNEPLSITFDSTISKPLMIHFPSSLSNLGLSIAVLPGDTVLIDTDKKNNSYNFSGKHSSELQFFKSLEKGKINLTSTSFWILTQYNRISYREYEMICKGIFNTIDSLVTKIGNDPQARPEIKKYIASEFALIKIGFLVSPVHRENLIGYPAIIPTSYEKLLTQFTAVLNHPEIAINKSERLVYALNSYATFLTMTTGKALTTENIFATAVRKFTGEQKILTCYYILRKAQRENMSIAAQLPEFQKMVTPQSMFSRALMKHEMLNNYPILEDIALNDTLVDVDGNKKLLHQIIAANKGNVIYIDLWATWCGPCLLELPNSRSLSEKYHDKNFKILYFSIDSKIPAWKEGIDKLIHRSEDNYLIRDMGKSGLIKKFSIGSIPRYLLIDRNGVVKFQKAQPPSDPALIPIIDQLLNVEN